MNKLTPPLLGMVIFLSQPINAEIFGGIEFPEGESSFADRVISYEPMFSGGPKPSLDGWDKPENALGIPNPDKEDCCAVTLGHGGRITLQFIDNALSGSNDTNPDLHIFEVGPDVEGTFVEISKDGVNFISIGKVFGSTSSIDIDSFGFSSEDHFNYVRLTDDPNEGSAADETSTPGADIDAVGAISTVKIIQPLLYIPLDKPCRLVDTRGFSSPFTDNTTIQSFSAWGSQVELNSQRDIDGSDQLSDCQIVSGMLPTALVANVTAVAKKYKAKGNLIAYPSGRTAPDSSLINFQSNNIANSSIITLSAGGSFDVKVQLFGNESDNQHKTDVIVDAIGYFYPLSAFLPKLGLQGNN